MMESIRESAKGPVFRGILFLVIFAFIFTGGSMLFQGNANSVATVNGEDISRGELENRVQSSRDQFGEMFDRFYDTDEKIQGFRRQILESLISEKLVQQAVEDMGLRISDTQLAKIIQSIPQFQKDGVYDKNTAEALLMQAGYTKETFKEQQRIRTGQQQLLSGLVSSSFVLEDEIQKNYELDKQLRSFRHMTLSVEKLKEQIEVSEEQIQEFYNTNQNQFQIPEKLKVAYVSVDAKKIAENIQVSDVELDEEYVSRKEQYRREGRRKASHILIEFGDDEDTARIQADGLLVRAKAGEDFALLAKENSSDTVSAEEGGALDWFGREEMVKPFEDAVFALEKVGDFAEVVKSEFGFHIIKLDGIEDETYLALDEVKSQLSDDIKQRKSEEEFIELATILEDKALEVIDEVDSIAEAVNAEVVTTEFFDRFSAPENLRQPNIIETIFSEEVLKERINSDVIKIDDYHYMVLRIADYQEPSTKPLDTVRKDIITSIQLDESKKLAAEKGKTMLAKLKNNESIENELANSDLEWKEEKDINRTSSVVDASIRTSVFKVNLPKDQSSLYFGKSLPSGDYSLVELKSISNGNWDDASDEDKKQIEERLVRMESEIFYKQFVEWLKDNSSINILI